jgi:hypothetical protein
MRRAIESAAPFVEGEQGVFRTTRRASNFSIKPLKRPPRIPPGRRHFQVWPPPPLIKISCFFRLEFQSIFDHFLGPFWHPKSVKIDVKIYVQIHVIFNRSFCDPKPLPGSLGTSKCLYFIVFLSVLAFPPFLVFECLSTQKRPKGTPKGAQKDL